jgi:Ohr subfamily peroxiredoxin
MALDKVMYTTEVTVTGGRNGTAKSADSRLDLTLTSPKELGGNPATPGTNPEQLFAAGYAACFLGAMGHVAKLRKIDMPKNPSIVAEVTLGQTGEKLGIAVKLHVTLPGMDKAGAEELVELGHQTCPYSHATRGNIDVVLTVSV